MDVWHDIRAPPPDSRACSSESAAKAQLGLGFSECSRDAMQRSLVNIAEIHLVDKVMSIPLLYYGITFTFTFEKLLKGRNENSCSPVTLSMNLLCLIVSLCVQTRERPHLPRDRVPQVNKQRTLLELLKISFQLYILSYIYHIHSSVHKPQMEPPYMNPKTNCNSHKDKELYCMYKKIYLFKL